jgi:rhodanese-related sulfurtransferase/peroxiredoxin
MSSGTNPISIPAEQFILLTRDVLVGLDALQIQPETQKKVAPVLSVTDAQGNRLTFPRPGKKYLFVNFWASWCVECRKEMPSLQNLWDKAQKDGDWDVLYLNWGELPDTAEKYLKRENFTMRTYYDRKKEVSKLYGVTGVPESYLINSQGLLIAKVTGPRDWSGPESIRMIDSFRLALGAGILPPSSARAIPAPDLKRKIESGTPDYVLIDLRPETEYAKGFIPTSFNLPPGVLMQHLGILPLDFTIIFVTADGDQAKRFAEAFARMGYPETRYLEGGIANWEYPLKTGTTGVPE